MNFWSHQAALPATTLHSLAKWKITPVPLEGSMCYIIIYRCIVYIYMWNPSFLTQGKEQVLKINTYTKYNISLTDLKRVFSKDLGDPLYNFLILSCVHRLFYNSKFKSYRQIVQLCQLSFKLRLL